MKLPDPREFETLLFDCDGVLLDSNQVKTDAFFSVCRRYGDQAARGLVDYHQKNGGISRYQKFKYFLSEIVGVEPTIPELQELLDAFAIEIREGLRTCAVAQGIELLKMRSRGARWAVVSGGDQSELRKVFKEKGIDWLFDANIFGSPDSKDVIVEREINLRNFRQPILFIGDSKYDYEIARKFGLSFLFLYQWTEFLEWKNYQNIQQFSHAKSINEWINSTL